ncbi:MAG: ABC transporter ATP-binding protein [Pseudolysinimonas sp.]|uniref:ABC transporter ATP-binding protein n=1 Tax=Pseudolysinimonas sp. TaxID=2680009 RepID=UPI003266B1F7
MPERAPVLLRVEHLKKVYETAQGRVEAIGDLSFEVRAGELVCIVGPSGAGKTTLLKCIAGLLTPTSGTVELDGVVVTGPPKRMALVFQEYGRSLFPWLTVAANVGLPLRNRRVPRDVRAATVERMLATVGLEGQGGKYPWQLSGGMQQRVAIARAVAYDPEILVMDEPFAAVDAQTRADLEDLVRELWSSLGVTVLFVTHDIDESVYLGERVLVLSSAPTFVQEVVEIDLPAVRDQLGTRADPRFAELRTRVYQQIQIAKRGPAASTKGES